MRLFARQTAFDRPGEDLRVTCLLGTQVSRVGADTSAHQVEPVGVPAGGNGDIRVSFAIRMPFNRLAECVQSSGSQVEHANKMTANKKG